MLLKSLKIHLYIAFSKKIILNFIEFSLISLVFFGCAQFSRKPANEEQPEKQSSQVRFATYNFDSDSDKKLIILGIKHNKPERKASLNDEALIQTFDLSALYDYRNQSFTGTDLDSVEPKFLFLKNSEGIKTVKSFGLNFLLPRFKSGYGLPPTLIHTDQARQSLSIEAAFDFLYLIGKFSPASPFVVLAEEYRTHRENQRLYQSDYLHFILNELLKNKELLENSGLSFQEVEYLAASLKLRYNEELKYSGLLTQASKRVEIYTTWKNQKNEVASRNMGLMIREANRFGLVPLKLSDEFVMLFAKKSSGSEEDEIERSKVLAAYQKFIIDTSKNDLESLTEYQSTSDFEPGNLVPLGIFSTNSNNGPLSLFKYTDIESNIKRNQLVDMANFARDLGLTFVPTLGLSIGLRVLDSTIEFVLEKKGKTFLKKIITSYAELAALSDLNLSENYLSSIQHQILLEALEDAGVNPDQIDLIKSELDSQDIEKQKNAYNNINSILTQYTYDSSQIFGGENQIKRNKRNNLYISRLSNYLRKKERVKKLEKKLRSQNSATDQKKSAREIATSNKNSDDSLTEKDKKPVILFMVDGLRVDRLIEASKQGYTPTLKKYFLDQGFQFNSYTSRSLTLPSWSSILTGFNPDETGVRSNSEVSRLEKGSLDSYIDWRKDILLPKYIKEGRSYKRLQKSKIKWLPRYFESKEVQLNFTPINDGAYPPVFNLVKNQIKKFPEAIRGAFPGVVNLDLSSSEALAQKINDDSKKTNPKLKLIMFWLATIDECSHYNNASLESGYCYKMIDLALKKVLEACENHPDLKNATISLVSDHGHVGGYDVDPLNKQKMQNTPFNLIQYFTGSNYDTTDYQFKVGSDTSVTPDFDLSYLKEFLIHPFSVTTVGPQGSPAKGRSMLIDYLGDNLAQIYIRRNEKKWQSSPTELEARLSYYELSNFKSESVKTTKNIISELLNYEIKYLASTNQNLNEKIKNETQNRPVQFLAMALSQAKAKQSIEKMINKISERNDFSPLFSRDPVLIQDQQKRTAIILTRDMASGESEYKYLVVKNFNQDSEGSINGELTFDDSDDPLNYLPLIKSSVHLTESFFQSWLSDRVWLKILQKSEHPTALFSLPQILTLSPRLSNDFEAQAALPDFIISANKGYSFQGGQTHESDHGGFKNDEVKISFFLSGLGRQKPKDFRIIPEPVLAKDVAPTLLDFAGFSVQEIDTQGKSLKPLIESNLNVNP